MRASKYHAKPTILDGIRFASKREANRYRELKLLERAGSIRHLELQKRFSLLVAGEKVATYIADFVYEEIICNGYEFQEVVEDCKGFRTREYKLKKKIFEAMYNTRIRET